MNQPKVYFVGAGPGDPGLITVRGLQLLELADCIIYDGLANPALLGCTKPDAETICVAKRAGDHPFKQDAINALIVEKSRQRTTIVRLKGGDPCLFGRAAEEIKVCVEAGISFEIVPGVTAGVAAAEYTGIFLTDREQASAVCFVTGHEAEGKVDTGLDWDNLAAFNGSLVIYMGMGNLEMISRMLIEKGKSPDTPAAVIQYATLPKQRQVYSTLQRISKDCQRDHLTAPAIIVIGNAVAKENLFSRNKTHPLEGQNIVVTRDSSGNQTFAMKLIACGANPIRFDSIEFLSLADSAEVQDVMKDIGKYDWIIFTSANGVRYTFEAMSALSMDARVFAGAKIACIGSQTAIELMSHGLKANFIPQSYTSEALVQGLVEVERLKGKRILLLRSEIAPNELPNSLRSKGADVTDVPVYTVRPYEILPEKIQQLENRIRDNQVNWITFTSSSTVNSFFGRIDKELIQTSITKIASIGPATTQQLKEYGLMPDMEATIHDIDGLITAMAGGRHD